MNVEAWGIWGGKGSQGPRPGALSSLWGSQERGPQHPTPPGAQAATEGLLTAEEWGPESPLLVQRSNAENVLALSMPQLVESGVTASHQRGLLCY